MLWFRANCSRTKVANLSNVFLTFLLDISFTKFWEILLVHDSTLLFICELSWTSLKVDKTIITFLWLGTHFNLIFILLSLFVQTTPTVTFIVLFLLSLFAGINFLSVFNSSRVSNLNICLLFIRRLGKVLLLFGVLLLLC